MEKLTKSGKRHSSRKSKNTRECPLCGKIIASRGLNGHINLVHKAPEAIISPVVNPKQDSILPIKPINYWQLRKNIEIFLSKMNKVPLIKWHEPVSWELLNNLQAILHFSSKDK